MEHNIKVYKNPTVAKLGKYLVVEQSAINARSKCCDDVL